MQVVLFSHVALACAEPAATEAFYTKYFTFRRVRSVGTGNDQVVFLKMEYCSMMLELFKAKDVSQDPPPTADGPKYPGSIRHLAFQVDDVDRTLAQLGDAAHVQLGPLDFSEVIPGWKTVWIADPDGRIVEISQGYQDQSG